MSSNDGLLRLLLIVVAVILLVPLSMMLFMLPMMGLGHMWYVNGTRGSLWAWIVILLVCLVVIFGILYLVYRALTGLQSQRSDAALEELRRTYARGQLTDEEFEERRARLKGEK